MFENFQDMQDVTGKERKGKEGGNVQRWCIAGVMGIFLFLQCIFTYCTMKFVSN